MSSSADIGKRAAAEAALGFVTPGSILGVGTGSTVNVFIDALATSRIALSGAISSSEASTARLKAAGYAVLDLNSIEGFDVYVDGADEATRDRHLIKGGGGALTREKIVAAAAKQFVCIVDESKVVPTLGRFPLPVEVIPMARSLVARELRRLGGTPVWRQNFVTDNGNDILDVRDLRIADPLHLERAIGAITGVVCVGLFAHRPADVLLVGSGRGVERI